MRKNCEITLGVARDFTIFRTVDSHWGKLILWTKRKELSTLHHTRRSHTIALT